MPNDITVKQCPFIQDKCVMDKCQLWVEGHDTCAIIDTAYSLNYVKEQIGQIIRQVEK